MAFLQKAKVYVQDRLRQSADKVWQLLETGAHFYVCGDAAHMAAAVEEALLDIIATSQVCSCCIPCALSRAVIHYASYFI